MGPLRNIEELAKLAGVSKSTVSRALNDNPVISRETRERVQKLARKHNFFVARTASSLSSGKTHCVGCIIRSQNPGPGELHNPFHMEIINSLSLLLPKRHYDLLLINTDKRRDNWALQYYRGKRVDAFIFLSFVNNERNIKMIQKSKAPFIVFGEDCSDQNVPSVRNDNLEGAYQAVKYLISKGRRSIAFIKGPGLSKESIEREYGFIKACREAGLYPDPSLIYKGGFNYNSGVEAIKKIMSGPKKPDAIFTSSDVAALGAIDELKNLGVKIPDDMAVMGYDNISVAAHYSPTLSTVSQNTTLCASVLTENLFKYLENREVIFSVLPPELIIRESA